MGEPVRRRRAVERRDRRRAGQGSRTPVARPFSGTRARAEVDARDAERPDAVRPEVEAARRPVEEARPAILATVVVYRLFGLAARRSTNGVRE
jgi:hypothetical protein